MSKSATASCLLTAVFLLSFPVSAHAGFMDKLNEATQKLQQTNQNMQQPQPGAYAGGGGGSLSSGLGATSFEALSKHNTECLGPLNGYRAKIAGDVIERKLSTETNLTPQQQQFLKEDLIAARKAQAAGTDSIVSPDGNSQRYLQDISPQEQMQINSQFAAFYQEITNKCQGADHMNIGHTTPMHYVQDNSAEMAERAKQEQGIAGMQGCMARQQGLRWQVWADKMQAKMNAIPNLSDAERAAWEADIAAVRQAATNGQMMPTSPDPSQPTRYMQRLSAEDQTAVNQEYSAAAQKLIAECSAMADTGPVRETAPRNDGLVDHTKSPANHDAVAPANKPYVPVGVPTRVGGGSLSSVLGATKVDYMRETSGCYEPLRGHLAMLTADKLQAKLNTAQGLTEEKRRQWQEDIAAWRDAQDKGKDQPVPPDPANPYRWYDYVTNDERAQINHEQALFNNKIVTDCGNVDPMGVH